MRKYQDDALCHRCHWGHLVSNDADQHCNYCGRIFYTEPSTVSFNDIAPGERFYSAYHPEDLLIKMTDSDLRSHWRNNYYHADDRGREGGCGPAAPCLREGARTMKMTGFSYN